MSGDRQPQGARLEVPELNVLRAAGDDGQGLVVGRKSQAPDGAVAAWQGRLLLARCEIPEAETAIALAAEQELARMREDDGGDGAVVLGELCRFSACAGIPQAERAVVASRGHNVAIRGE